MRTVPLRPVVLIALIASVFLIGTFSPLPAIGATTVTVYQSQRAVTLDGAAQPSEWSDTPIVTDSNSGLTYGLKQNGTGLLFLMQWSESIACPTCFAGFELGHQNNTADMGSASTPTIMILASPSFKGSVDDFISTGEFTPTPVEQDGYATQTVCGLGYAGGVYTAECYRPFKLTNASPYDFNFTVGSTAEIGFAVGVFTQPGNHLATDMSTYVLSITSQTYASPSTTSSGGHQTTTATASTESSSSSTSSSSVSTVSTVTTSVPTYADELLVIAVGFSVLILVALAKYERG
jgi:hypothetical protein